MSRQPSRRRIGFFAVLAGLLALPIVLASPAGAATFRIMPLGDSITEGNVAPGGYRVGLEDLLAGGGYSFDFVGSQVQSNAPASLADREHEGHPGFTINGIRGGIVGWLNSFTPDVVLLMIGANDMFDAANAPTAHQRLGSLLDDIRITRPSTHVIVAKITPQNNAETNPRVVNYNGQIPSVVATMQNQGMKISLVDMYSIINFNGDMHDGLHPNATGQQKIANVWYTGLQGVLGPPSGGGGGSVSLSATPSSVAPGGQVTATWSGISGPSPTDWVGLYAPGSADGSYVAWRYTTGAAGGNVGLTVPANAAAGAHELRLFRNNTYTKLATSNTFTVGSGGGGGGAASLSASPSSVAPGGQVTATWSGISGPTATDWVGLHAPGSADGSFVAWRYTTGAAGGNVGLTVPANLAGGAYELRLFASNGFTRLATSNTFTVGSGGGGGGSASLSASPASVVAGGQVTATWSGISAPSANDWVGMYVPGAADGSFVAWRYTTGAAGGNVGLTVPANVAAGTYELRLFRNNTYTRLATSNTFTVGGGGGGGSASLSASPSSVARGGQVTATWSGISGPTATDWVGLYAPGSADGSFLAWRYTTGAASGNVGLTVPANLAVGAHELRLFANDGFTRLATSNTFSVVN